MKQTDSDAIKSATSVYTYWFIDCVYYGFTSDLKFDFNYTDPDHEHVVEALIVADFTPLPPSTTVPPPTTTTKATTTTAKPTTTTTPTTTKPTTTTAPTTAKPTTATAVTTSVNPKVADANKNLVKREVSTKDPQKIMKKVNGTLVPYIGSFPYVCNGTEVTIDPRKTYGYFTDVIDVKGMFSCLWFGTILSLL